MGKRMCCNLLSSIEHDSLVSNVIRELSQASVRDMLSWTSSSISAPMVGAEWDKAHKKAAIDLFRLVQIYMGDRKARPGMTLNSVAQDILHATFSNEKLVFM